MSSNPGNLTSATVCGDRTGCAPPAKRLASVAPEVDLGECTLHSPPQKANKAEPTLALNPRNPKQGYQWPQKGYVCPPKTFSQITRKPLSSVHARKSSAAPFMILPLVDRLANRRQLRCVFSPCLWLHFVSFVVENVSNIDLLHNGHSTHNITYPVTY